MKRYIEFYTIEEILLANVIKLKFPELIRIHSVVNISWVVRYRKLVRRQKVKEIEVES